MSVNGTGERRIFHAVPKFSFFAIEVERLDKVSGEIKPVTLEFKAYHRYRCPAEVDIEVQAAWELWTSLVMVPNTDNIEILNPGTGKMFVPEKVSIDNPTADVELRKAILLAIMPELRPEDVPCLVAEEGGWREMLNETGWWKTGRREEPIANPESKGEESSGASSSPNLAPVTESTTGV